MIFNNPVFNPIEHNEFSSNSGPFKTEYIPSHRPPPPRSEQNYDKILSDSDMSSRMNDTLLFDGRLAPYKQQQENDDRSTLTQALDNLKKSVQVVNFGEDEQDTSLMNMYNIMQKSNYNNDRMNVGLQQLDSLFNKMADISDVSMKKTITNVTQAEHNRHMTQTIGDDDLRDELNDHVYDLPHQMVVNYYKNKENQYNEQQQQNQQMNFIQSSDIILQRQLPNTSVREDQYSGKTTLQQQNQQINYTQNNENILQRQSNTSVREDQYSGKPTQQQLNQQINYNQNSDIILQRQFPNTSVRDDQYSGKTTQQYQQYQPTSTKTQYNSSSYVTQDIQPNKITPTYIPPSYQSYQYDKPTQFQNDNFVQSPKKYDSQKPIIQNDSQKPSNLQNDRSRYTAQYIDTQSSSDQKIHHKIDEQLSQNNQSYRKVDINPQIQITIPKNDAHRMIIPSIKKPQTTPQGDPYMIRQSSEYLIRPTFFEENSSAEKKIQRSSSKKQLDINTSHDVSPPLYLKASSDRLTPLLIQKTTRLNVDKSSPIINQTQRVSGNNSPNINLTQKDSPIKSMTPSNSTKNYFYTPSQSNLPPQNLPPQNLPPQNLPPQNLPPQTQIFSQQRELFDKAANNVYQKKTDRRRHSKAPKWQKKELGVDQEMEMVICINCDELITYNTVDAHSKDCIAQSKLKHRQQLEFIHVLLDELNRKLEVVKHNFVSQLRTGVFNLFDQNDRVVDLINKVISDDSDSSTIFEQTQQLNDILSNFQHKNDKQSFNFMLLVRRAIILSEEKGLKLQFMSQNLIDTSQSDVSVLYSELSVVEKLAQKERANLEIWRIQHEMMVQVQVQDLENMKYLKNQFVQGDNEILSQIRSDWELRTQDNRSYQPGGGTSLLSDLHYQKDIDQVYLGKVERQISKEIPDQELKRLFYNMAVQIKLSLSHNNQGKNILIQDLYNKSIQKKISQDQWYSFISKEIRNFSS